MHPETIKAQIRIRYGTLTAFEIAAGLPRDAVRDVLRGRPARRAAAKIAEVLGVELNDLFPGRFDGKPYDNTRNRGLHRLNARRS